jgi:L-threonylcarbamoyladenylate synthase
MPILSGNDPAAVQRAAEALRDGALVALPTETVYGLAARADDEAAVAAIFAAKGRPADHPLIVHVADAQGAGAFASTLSPAAQRLMACFWPGPLTLIVPRRPGIAAAAAGGQASIGLRCPSHPVAQALLRRPLALGVPGLAAPSANRFGRISPTRAAHVEQEFGVDLIVLDGGACAVGIESTIVDCLHEPPALLRPGGVPREAIEALLGTRLRAPDAASPRASGTLEAHYAPRARLRLVSAQDLAAGPRPDVAVYSRLPVAPEGWSAVRTMPDDAAAAAHELFAVLRELDSAAAAQIWVETPPADPAWEGVNDRLRRAAAA